MATKQEMADGWEKARVKGVVDRAYYFSVDYHKIKYVINLLASGTNSQTIGLSRPNKKWYKSKLDNLFSDPIRYGFVEVTHSRANEFTFSFVE